MAKKIKKTTKTAKTSRLAHEVKHTDWKFVVILILLTIIGLGIFKIYQGVNLQSPEAFYYNQGGMAIDQNKGSCRECDFIRTAERRQQCLRTCSPAITTSMRNNH